MIQPEDFKKEFIAKLEYAIPELRDKIQAGAVDAQTPVPYAAFSVPEEVVIRTMSGIAGYNTTFELAVYHSKMSEVEKLKHRIIQALDSEELQHQRCYYRSCESAYYPDYGVHGYSLNFKIV